LSLTVDSRAAMVVDWCPVVEDTSGVKRNFWLAKFLTTRHVRMHKVIFYISNTLRKFKIGA